MQDIFEMWKDTRMVVYTAVTAAIYAATVIPLKIATIIPGLTEVRPGVATVVFCSFLFGPAGAWGAAFGNLIADFFGTLGLGSIFGFIGNFVFGLIPYRLYRAMNKNASSFSTPKQWIYALISMITASLACGLIIGWGVDLLKLVPFQILGGIISLNNVVSCIPLTSLLLLVLYERAKKWGITYQLILDSQLIHRSRFSVAGVILTVTGAFGGIIIGLLAGYGLITVPIPLSAILTIFSTATIAGALLL